MTDKPHITETPDTSYIKNIDVTHEVSDVHINGIGKFVIGLFILLVASFVFMWGLFRILDSKSVDQAPSPMALREKDRLPPEPRLQSAPGFGEQLDKTAPAQKENKAELSPEIKGKAPAPKDPMWEIRVLRDQWSEVLKNGPSDQNSQHYGMPIEQAKQEVLKQLEQQKKQAATP
ncbi:MAG: hypothetical protein ABR607_02890 [Pyrinomonadaceae bacterium]